MTFNAIIIQETRWSVKKHVAIQLVCAESWITENICPLQFQLYANALNKQSLIRPIKQRPSFCGEIAWGQFNVHCTSIFLDLALASLRTASLYMSLASPVRRRELIAVSCTTVCVFEKRAVTTQNSGTGQRMTLVQKGERQTDV